MNKKILTVGVVCIIVAIGLVIAFSPTLTTKNVVNLNAEIEKTIKEASKQDMKVVEAKKLDSFNNFLFVRMETSSGKQIPVFVSSDGKSFIGFSQILFTPLEKDNTIISGMLQEITVVNKKLEATELEKSAEENAGKAQKLFSSFAEDRFVFLQSSNPEITKTLVVVTDPDCPYCRQELNQIENRLKTANVKLIFAPVHDDRAFVKSELIMKEANEANTVEEKISIVRKYYVDMQLTQEQMNTDMSKTKDNAQKLFSSGIVKGVPFIHELRK